MQDYIKNRKPMVKVTATKEPKFQGDHNLAPVVRTPGSKSAYGENVLPKNKVSQASSSKLQQAIRTIGRVAFGGSANKKLS